MKIVYKEDCIEFYKNVNPSGFMPLWDLDFVAKTYTDIPQEYWDKLSEDAIDSIMWHLLDLDMKGD